MSCHTLLLLLFVLLAFISSHGQLGSNCSHGSWEAWLSRWLWLARWQRPLRTFALRLTRNRASYMSPFSEVFSKISMYIYIYTHSRADEIWTRIRKSHCWVCLWAEFTKAPRTSRQKGHHSLMEYLLLGSFRIRSRSCFCRTSEGQPRMERTLFYLFSFSKMLLLPDFCVVLGRKCVHLSQS